MRSLKTPDTRSYHPPGIRRIVRSYIRIILSAVRIADSWIWLTGVMHPVEFAVPIARLQQSTTTFRVSSIPLL